jgi:hypothetical protein
MSFILRLHASYSLPACWRQVNLNCGFTEVIPFDQKLDLLLISHSQQIVQSDMTVAGGTSFSAVIDSVHVINYGVVRNSPAMCFIALITTVVEYPLYMCCSFFILALLYISF